MSYYKPSFSQSLAMARGRGYSASRSSYRGSSNRGNSWGNGGVRGYSGGGRFSSSFSSMDSRSPYDSRSKYGPSERFSRSDDYHKSYRADSGYLGRDGRRSPERKRMRMDAPSSRHDSYGGYGSRPPSYSDRRGYSSERHPSSTPFRREDFRRPTGPSIRGSYRGRISSRGSRGLRLRERGARRRLVDSSYAVRKRGLVRATDFNRRLKISKMRSAIARKVTKRKDSDKEGSDDEKSSSEKKDDDEDEEKGDEEKDEDSPKKEGDNEDKDAKSETGEEKLMKKKAFIKLLCPHCGIKTITFRKYDIHLSSRTHLIAMRKIAFKQKAILAQMRQAQRNTQNELEKNSEDLSSKTNFCPLCKLNYKQKKAVHQLSEAHKNMKKFLMPFCKVCKITFKSPMIYESHCCSIDHIKRKQRLGVSSEASAEEDNLENFTTIDSVGDGDGEVDVKTEDNEPVNVGIEQIRRIDAQYCDLCKMYLPRGDDIDEILSRHCKQRVHMQRYVRMKERQELEKRAEKLQRKETAEKEVKVKEEGDAENNEDNDESAKDAKEDEAKAAEDDEAKDDKLWADVDKDLGDILAEAESGNKSSDEDEDSHVNGERYDRFKLSEKNGDEKLMTADEESMLDNTEDAKMEVEETK